MRDLIISLIIGIVFLFGQVQEACSQEAGETLSGSGTIVEQKKTKSMEEVKSVLLAESEQKAVPQENVTNSPDESIVVKPDIILVLDNSGSMKKNDPKFLTREVVSNFVSELGKNARLGMVIFDQEAQLIEPLREVKDPEARSRLMKNLDNVNYKGLFTNSPAGIERAIYELKTNGRNEAQKVIIFLTDGIVDTGDKNQDIEKERWLKEDLAKECEYEKIRIMGIAFTDKADFRLIQTLALKTGGDYFRAYKATDIENVFSKIQDAIRKTIDTKKFNTQDYPSSRK